MNLLIGQIGHLFVIISFVSSIVAAIAYYFASQNTDLTSPQKLQETNSWKKMARLAFGVHAFSVIGVVVVLFSIIYNHQYEYHYAWSHSSNNLPYYYMISCFWEGQEGSFLLWIFWHVCIGAVIILRSIFVKHKKDNTWEAPVMMVFAAVQAFLASMILGVIVPFAELKIGSSPFILLRDAMDAPIFQSQPDYIPVDGTGLNPLLQNYWMVIHPPTLFLGFALCLVPFAFVIAGLWKKETTKWLKPTFAWSLLAAAVLGIGIVMGAYWAYETLNFGGYWNWDPVENAVFIPWLVLIAGIHAMTMQQKRPSMAKLSAILMLSVFLLILYSTFLTRSGILGDSSVHSFTDLGLSGQLLIYLLFFTVGAKILFFMNWNNFPKSKAESSFYSGEFWVTLGVVVLGLSALQVLVPTSIPVYNAILDALGIDSNVAPPADPESFYTKWQLWFSVGIAFLSATGQIFWWKRIEKSNIKDNFVIPLVLTAIITTIIIAVAQIKLTLPSQEETTFYSIVLAVIKAKEIGYVVLVLTATYALVSNGISIARTIKLNPKLAGGALAHIGVALMFFGILSSSGYDEIVSMNMSGLLYNKEFSDEVNRENVLLFRSQPTKMSKYTVTYKGQYWDSPNFSHYVNKEDVKGTAYAHKVVAQKDLIHNDKVEVKAGDTLRIFEENTYYKIDYVDTLTKEMFTLFPRVQQNPQMGFVVSPDISQGIKSDLYTHLSSLPDPAEERTWSKPEQKTLSPLDTFIVNDFVAVLDGVHRGKPLADEDYMIYAEIRILDREETYTAKPIFQIKGNEVRGVPEIIESAGVEFTMMNIDPKTEEFTFNIRTTQRDWIIMKALEKPYISLLWLGVNVMTLGILVAMWRRYTEAKKVMTSKKSNSKKPKNEVELV
ncbi:cytochrome c biogenesis protein CcsA [Bernardetia sp. OM2101]|uniref:cytochrome c biogenesis protein CcsA n=1 Tax=Bernardetia sp. OM2101 TaxID=3344876 RepID=UPI0035CFD3AF